MTPVLVPEEAATYLGAILLAFNRKIFGSLLDESDALAEGGHASSAVLIAGNESEFFLFVGKFDYPFLHRINLLVFYFF